MSKRRYVLEGKQNQKCFCRYEEVCTHRYTFGNSAPSGTLHFTQVVWDGSKELGIGMATGKKGSMTCTYVVGRYRPAGNYAAQYQKNVPRGSFNTGICKKLEKIVKEIEDSSYKNHMNFVNVDDKFGQEKVKHYGDKKPFLNSSTFANEKDGTQGKIPQASSSEKKPLRFKENAKMQKTEDNVIQMDEKADSVEDAENLIGKDKKDDKKAANAGGSQLQKGNGKAAKLAGKGPKVDEINENGSKVNRAKYVKVVANPTSDMKITSGIPLSRGSQTLKKKKGGSGHKFLIKTDYDAPVSQREIDSTSDDFTQKGLTAHNAFRKIHGTSPMTLDPKMSAEAEEYAKVIADKGSLVHSKTGGKYGENLAMGCTSKNEEMSAEEATKNW